MWPTVCSREGKTKEIRVWAVNDAMLYIQAKSENESEDKRKKKMTTSAKHCKGQARAKQADTGGA
jgi:hypothetical protein